jgi:hypothetical protein
MTFTYKLSKRLAHSKATVLSAARALFTPRQVPAALPCFVPPLTTVNSSPKSPSVRWDALACRTRPSSRRSGV